MNKRNACPQGISRTCEKVLAVLLRKDIELKPHFIDVDPKGCGLISDSKFFVIVYNRFGREFGLCQEEVRELGDYLKKENGEVDYIEFLELVLPLDKVQEAFVTGLEWEDHKHVNVLSPFDARKLNLIMTKIAYICQQRDVHLESYFKDYDRVSGNNGTVTFAHFRRILNFAEITLGDKEFQLVVNRFMKYGYSINYVAFLTAIQEILEWFDVKGFLDEDKDFYESTDKIIIADVDSLPRPEVGKVDIAETFKTEKSSHPCVHQNKKPKMNFNELLLRIKKHVFDSSIRTREFFQKFDYLYRDYITKSQFHRGLDAIGLSGLHRFYVAPQDLQTIFDKYQDPCDPERVNWSNFCDDVDEVFTLKNLDKHPYKVVESPPEEIRQMSRSGAVDWDHLTQPEKNLAQETLFRIRNILKARRIFLESFFKSFDKSNRFHVTRCQMRRVFSSNSILLSENEMTALMDRYGDDMGFNYWKFLEDVDDVQFCEAKHEDILTLLKKINEKSPLPCSKSNFSIIDVFAKVKGQVTRNRINIDQFLCNGEKVNEGKVPESKFRSSFSAAGIKLNDCELDILCKSFRLPCDPNFIDHKSFCEMINQAFFRTKLEKLPLTQPVQFVPSPDDSLNFLDFEERCTVSQALQKLSRYNDDVSNMKSFFDDRTRKRGTIIDKSKLEQVLIICGGLNELLTKKEFDAVFKCFSKPCGSGSQFDYKNFLFVVSSLN